MEYNSESSLQILSRTPVVLEYLLGGLGEEWTTSNEGPETWSPYDVLGHLIHGEKTDWLARVNKILSETGDKTFDSFDRFAQFTESKGKSVAQLLAEFKEIRNENLKALISLNLKKEDLNKTGIHPVFGDVTLSHLLSTWTAHDLAHLGQIARVMAKQYKEAVGPWIEFLPIMTR